MFNHVSERSIQVTFECSKNTWDVMLTTLIGSDSLPVTKTEYFSHPSVHLNNFDLLNIKCNNSSIYILFESRERMKFLQGVTFEYTKFTM